MKIANPIYDAAFKYLMEDSKAAKLLISTILDQEVESLEYKPQEHIVDIDRSDSKFTVYRLDFAAQIKTPEGVKTVLIEIQKAKFPSDIMRFRRYLGSQYSNKNNISRVNNFDLPTPIITIYILGYMLEVFRAPVVKINRQAIDAITEEVLLGREEFVEGITHDAYIIQVPLLQPKRRTTLEHVLEIFDQDNMTSENHILNIKEENFPEKYQPIIRRLQSAIVSEELCQRMIIEDEIIGDFQCVERELAIYRGELTDARKELIDARKELESRDIELGNKDKLIAELMAKITDNK